MEMLVAVYVCQENDWELCKPGAWLLLLYPFPVRIGILFTLRIWQAFDTYKKNFHVCAELKS